MQPFTEHHSRRSTKRRRQRSAAQQHQQQPRQSGTPGGQDLSRQRSGKLLMGKSTSTGGHLTAAKKIIKRAVFCVDNV